MKQRASSFRRAQVFGLAAVLLITSNLCLLVALPGRAMEAEEAAKHLLVMLGATLGKEKTFGAGIIVGTRADRLYIVTSNHLVRKGLNEAKDLQIELRSLPGETIEAHLLESNDTTLDIAVLNVTSVSNIHIPVEDIPFDILADAQDLKRRDAVFPVGNPNGQKWRSFVTPNVVSQVLPFEVRFESSFIAPGSSGGGLFNDNWELVGMVTKDAPPDGVAIPMDKVIKKLKAWGFPVALKSHRTTPCDGKPRPLVSLRSSSAKLTSAMLKQALSKVKFTATLPSPPGTPPTVLNGIFRNSFVKVGDFVADCATGLMWQRGTAGPFTPLQAQQHVKSLNEARHGGYVNWRVPTAEELASLTQSKGVDVPHLVTPLFLDPNFFDGTAYYCQSCDKTADFDHQDSILIITWAERPGAFGFMPAQQSYPVKAVRTIE